MNWNPPRFLKTRNFHAYHFVIVSLIVLGYTVLLLWLSCVWGFFLSSFLFLLSFWLQWCFGHAADTLWWGRLFLLNLLLAAWRRGVWGLSCLHVFHRCDRRNLKVEGKRRAWSCKGYLACHWLSPVWWWRCFRLKCWGVIREEVKSKCIVTVRPEGLVSFVVDRSRAVWLGFNICWMNIDMKNKTKHQLKPVNTLQDWVISSIELSFKKIKVKFKTNKNKHFDLSFQPITDHTGLCSKAHTKHFYFCSSSIVIK